MSLSMQGSGRECWENSQHIDMRDPYSREQLAQSEFLVPSLPWLPSTPVLLIAPVTQ